MPINKTILIIFALQAAIVFPFYFFYLRRAAISKHDKRLIMVAFLASPVFIAIKGISSAIYFSDLAGPLLLFGAMFRFRHLTTPGRRMAYLLAALLLIVPMFCTAVTYILPEPTTQFTARGLQSLAIWFYRNSLYLSIFIIAASVPLDMDRFIGVLKAILIMNLSFIIIGALDYTGIYEFSAYELIVASVTFEHYFSYSNTTLGWGFLGMFRGAVGHWFAITCLLGVPFIIASKGLWRIIALISSAGATALVLCSLSRAGMVGIAVGLVVSVVALGVRGLRILIPVALAGLAMLPILFNSVIEERITSITSYAESKQVNRIDGWEAAFSYFGEHPATLLFGNGATNRDDVFKIIGAYGAHNEYIDVIFRSGLFGLATLLTVIFFMLVNLRSKLAACRQPRLKPYIAACLAIFVASCLMGGTQDHFYRDYSGYSAGILLYLLYGIFFAVNPRLQNQPVSMQQPAETQQTPPAVRYGPARSPLASTL